MLLVLTFHIDANLHAPFGPPTSAVPLWLAFVRAGHSGVDLFFVLSSFLLSLPFFTAAAQGRRLNTRGYFARRALRILPLYYSAVAVGTVVCARGPGDLARGLPYLLFLNALATPLTPWSAVWWSLCTEAQFYLLLPFLSPCLRSRTGRVWGLVALAAYAAVYSAFFAGVFRMPTNYMAAWLGMSLFGRAPQFLAGIAAAALYARGGCAGRAELEASFWLRNGCADAMFWGGLLAQGWLLQWLVPLGAATERVPYHAWHILSGGLWAIVLLLLVLSPLRSKPLFCNRWFTTLGVLSYSVYIVHVPLVRLSFQALRGAGLGCVYDWNVRSAIVGLILVAVCLALSAMTYRLIERPFLVRKESLRA